MQLSNCVCECVCVCVCVSVCMRMNVSEYFSRVVTVDLRSLVLAVLSLIILFFDLDF